MHGAQSRRRGSIGADEVIIGRLRRESSIATNRRVLTGEIAEASRRSLEARSRSREVSVSTRGLDNLRGGSGSLALAALVGRRILLGLSAAPDATSGIFNVAGFVDDRSEGDGVDEVTFGTTVADTVEVVVSTVADNTAAALESAGLEDEMRRDLVGGVVGVGRGNTEHIASGEGLVEDIFGVGPGVVNVNVVGLSVVELGVNELAGGSLVTACGGVLGVEVGAELEVLDLGVGGILQRGHGDDIFMRDGVESDVVEGIHFSVGGGVAVSSIASSVFLGVVVISIIVIVVMVILVLIVVAVVVMLASLVIVVVVVTRTLMMIMMVVITTTISSLMLMIRWHGSTLILLSIRGNLRSNSSTIVVIVLLLRNISRSVSSLLHLLNRLWGRNSRHIFD